MAQEAPENARKAPRWRRWLIDLLIVVLVISAVRLWMQRGMVDGEVPDIATATLDGTPVQLSQHSDGALLVHFWATWCGVCSLTQSGIDGLSKDRPVLTVALRSGDAEAVQHHMDRKDLSHPVILDEQGALAERFGVSGVPASFIIDRHGRIRYRNSGLTPAWELRLRMAWINWRE